MTYLVLQNPKLSRLNLGRPNLSRLQPNRTATLFTTPHAKLRRKHTLPCGVLSQSPKLLIICFVFLTLFQTSTASTQAADNDPGKTLTRISAVAANSLGDLFIALHSDSTNQTMMSQVGTVQQALLNEARIEAKVEATVEATVEAEVEAEVEAKVSDGKAQQLSPEQQQANPGSTIFKLPSAATHATEASDTRMQSTVLFTANLHASALRYIPLSNSSTPGSNDATLLSGQQNNNLRESENNSTDYQGALYIAANEFPVWQPHDIEKKISYVKKNNAGLTNLHRLALDSIDGQWRLNEEYSKELDLTQIDGLFDVGELLTSPWETLLAIESIAVESTEIWNAPQQAMLNHKLAHIRESAETVNQYLNRESNPYRYGYVVELIDQPLQNNYAGPEIQRHYATGRLPAGKTLLSPDGKTLYRVAATSGILFRFISEFPNNLAAGTLSVGRFIPIQPDAGNPYIFEAFNLEWIELGRGNNEEIAGWIADYEGMSANDFSANQTSYLSDEEVAAWFKNHKHRHLNDTGDIDQYIDSRVAFLEPIKAATAIGADRQAIKVRDITQTDNNIVLKVAADNIGECGELFTGAPDIEGNLNYVKRIKPASTASTSLCGEKFVLSRNERFLPKPGTVYMTNGSDINRIQLPVAEN